MSITTILNLYRRPHLLQRQVDSIRSQSAASKDDQIWLWINSHEDNLNFDPSSLGIDTVIRSSKNFKFHGRFSAGLLARTKYLAYFDDDTIPGDLWYSNCLNTITFCQKVTLHDNFILGSAGVILHSAKYQHHTRIGWPNPNHQIQPVDLVGHAWFFKKELLKYLWYEDPISLENGEDIQLSYLAQKYIGAMTLVPPHTPENKALWGSIEGERLGTDKVAMSNGHIIPHQQFFDERDNVVKKALEGGWKTVISF